MDKDVRIVSGEIADYWLDKEGILHGETKENPRTTEAVEKNFEIVRSITSGKRVCFLVDNTHTTSYDIDSLMLLLREFAECYKAVAFVSRSSIGKMVGHISVELKPDGIPIKVFSTSEEALDWLREFL